MKQKNIGKDVRGWGPLLAEGDTLKKIVTTASI